MTDWLRPVFGRTKSSLYVSSTPTTSADRGILDDAQCEDHAATSKPRPSSRVISFIARRPSSPPHPSPEAFSNIDITKRPYPLPDVDRMVETLKVVMMNHDSFSPLPREYNAYILHLLEAYQNLREKLAKKHEIIEGLKKSHSGDLEEFETLAAQWELKEQDYKREVKRLEVLLSKVDGGIENVTMARSKSRVHGTQRFSDSIESGISTIKGRRAARDEKDSKEEMEQRDDEIRAAVRRSEVTMLPGVSVRTITANDIVVRECSIDSTSSAKASPVIDTSINHKIVNFHDHEEDTSSKFASAASNNLNSETFRQSQVDLGECGIGHDPKSSKTTIGDTLSLHDPHEKQRKTNGSIHHSTVSKLPTSEPELGSINTHSHLAKKVTGLCMHVEPLAVRTANQAQDSKIRTPLVGRAAAVPTEETELQTSYVPRTRNRFSFQPGDDSELFSPILDDDIQNENKTHEHQSTPAGEYTESRENLGLVSSGKKLSTNKIFWPSSDAQDFSSQDSGIISEDLSVSRAASSGSVVTAIRHNSGRSSRGEHASTPSHGYQVSSTSKSKTADIDLSAHKIHSKEAVTAASRAFKQGSVKAVEAGLPAYLQPDLRRPRPSQQRMESPQKCHK